MIMALANGQYIMKLGSTCPTCGERVDETIRCRECGRGLHSRCADYHLTFDCQRCGDELWIGAVEL